MIAKESPLQGMKIGTAATVAIRELPGLHTIDLRVAPGTLAQAAVVEALGIELPETTGQTRVGAVSGGDEAHALCLAPDWWLIVGFQEVEQKPTIVPHGSVHIVVRTMLMSVYFRWKNDLLKCCLVTL